MGAIQRCRSRSLMYELVSRVVGSLRRWRTQKGQSMAMTTDLPLAQVFAGWEGHQTSLVNTVADLTAQHLAYQPAPDVYLAHLAGRPIPRLRTVGETVRHMSAGRIDWFLRMQPPGGEDIAALVPAWTSDNDGNRYMDEQAIATTPDDLVKWLKLSWTLIDQTLTQWTVGDLAQTYRHTGAIRSSQWHHRRARRPARSGTARRP